MEQAEKVEYTKSQEIFLTKALAGENIFLTGKAGTGKSFIVQALIQKLKDQKKNVVAIAPTGVAANNIGGQTIHSLFCLTPAGVLDFDVCNFLKTQKRKLIKAIDVIVIDEVSMLRPDVLDAINWTFLKNGCGSLLDKQIIFVGDLMQLPPVLNENTRSVLLQTYDGDEFFYAKIYSRLSVQKIELNEVLRQSDPEFIDNLNIIRDGKKSPYFKRFAGSDLKGIVLAPHNSTVEKYNRQGLESLKSELFTFEATVTGNIKADEFNLPATIHVKNGAKIMYLVNSENKELVNGTIGIFVSHNGCHFIRVGEVDYALTPVMFTKKEYVLNEYQNKLELREIGSIEQYPFKLAYAISIHKSQGLTFDEVTIDLSRPCFQKGQLYVALSRVKTPEGLRIIV